MNIFFKCFACVVLASGCLIACSTARADLIASDSYVVGGNPLAGQYSAASLQTGQSPNLTNPGFVAGGYTHGLGTNNFVASSAGLSSVVLGEDPATSGSVNWLGAANDGVQRSVARNLSSVPATVGTYWFSAVVSMNSVATAGAGTVANPLGFVLGGYGNATFPSTGTTSPFYQGLYFGFAHESTDLTATQGDLVIRYRTPDTTGGKESSDAVLVNNATLGATYTIIARLDVNVGGGTADNLTYWVNPTDISSQAAMDKYSLMNNDGTANGGPITTYAFQTSADFARLNYADQDWTGNASFDGMKLATSLGSLAPAITAVPEPGSMVLVSISLIMGLGLAIRRRARV